MSLAARLDITRHSGDAWRGGQTKSTSRLVAEETAIALTYNGSTQAVMMGTPGDLEDFGIGFSLTEAIVERASEISSIELIPNDLGVEVRMWLDGDRAASLAARRRTISGPVGCGLCGIESLEQARRAPARVKGRGIVFHARDLLGAMQALSPHANSKSANAGRPRGGLLASGAPASAWSERTSAGTMRSTSSPVRSYARGDRRAMARCC